jgi:hypothetical protein
MIYLHVGESIDLRGRRRRCQASPPTVVGARGDVGHHPHEKSDRKIVDAWTSMHLPSPCQLYVIESVVG